MSDDKERIGGKCVDGSKTDATGRGAGSHHGGILYWILKDGTFEYTKRYYQLMAKKAAQIQQKTAQVISKAITPKSQQQKRQQQIVKQVSKYMNQHLNGKNLTKNQSEKKDESFSLKILKYTLLSPFIIIGIILMGIFYTIKGILYVISYLFKKLFGDQQQEQYQNQRSSFNRSASTPSFSQENRTKTNSFKKQQAKGGQKNGSNMSLIKSILCVYLMYWIYPMFLSQQTFKDFLLQSQKNNSQLLRLIGENLTYIIYTLYALTFIMIFSASNKLKLLVVSLYGFLWYIKLNQNIEPLISEIKGNFVEIIKYLEQFLKQKTLVQAFTSSSIKDQIMNSCQQFYTSLTTIQMSILATLAIIGFFKVIKKTHSFKSFILNTILLIISVYLMRKFLVIVLNETELNLFHDRLNFNLTDWDYIKYTAQSTISVQEHELSIAYYSNIIGYVSLGSFLFSFLMIMAKSKFFKYFTLAGFILFHKFTQEPFYKYESFGFDNHIVIPNQSQFNKAYYAIIIGLIAGIIYNRNYKKTKKIQNSLNGSVSRSHFGASKIL